jgi:hypothetical protein
MMVCFSLLYNAWGKLAPCGITRLTYNYSQEICFTGGRVLLAEKPKKPFECQVLHEHQVPGT